MNGLLAGWGGSRNMAEALAKQLDQLRSLLAETHDCTCTGDWPEMVDDNSHRPAAVLVPLVLGHADPAILLTRRTDHLHHHPGQISFPGGRVEEQDSTAVDTALRETEEEIGLSRRHVELLGALPDYYTGTGFRVTPIVGLVHPRSSSVSMRSRWRKPSRCLWGIFSTPPTISATASCMREGNAISTRCLTRITSFGGRRRGSSCPCTA